MWKEWQRSIDETYLPTTRRRKVCWEWRNGKIKDGKQRGEIYKYATYALTKTYTDTHTFAAASTPIERLREWMKKKERKRTLIKESKAFRCYVMVHITSHSSILLQFVNGPCLYPLSLPFFAAFSLKNLLSFFVSPRDALLSHLKYTRNGWRKEFSC